MSVVPNPWHDFSTPQALEDGSATPTYAEMDGTSPDADSEHSREMLDHGEMLQKALSTINQQSELINKLMGMIK
jgi:hypothetical protein